MGALTRDVLGKATPLGQRIWTLDHAADVTVPLDVRRITQARQQLASNAVKHSAEGSKVSRAEGPGLGLNIVTAIVGAHGGTVDVQSAPGDRQPHFQDGVA